MNYVSDRLVLVTGANGFIGQVVVVALQQRGWPVRALMRHPRPCPAEVVTGDMRDGDSLRAALTGVAVVVHLAAAKSDEPDSDDVNVEGARRLVEACQATGCRRLINISTQSAKIARQGTYARTKHAADDIFHASDLDVTTLMPSVVYGDEKSGVFGTVLGFIQKLPVVPVLGNGRWISAPVYVGDVAQAIVACIEHDATIGKRYDIGGPDLIRFDDLIDKLAATVGRRRPKLHIPFGLALLLARVATKLLPNPPITVSNVLGSNQDTDIDITPARRDFGFEPVGLDDGLRRVLGGAQPLTPDRELTQESAMIARYLLGVEPPRELHDRYATAARKVLGDQTDPELIFVRRHPRTLPLVDAAAAWLRPQSAVRQRVFLMTAILEATPLYADFFLRPQPSGVRLVAELAWQSFRAGVKITCGIPVFLVARRG
jgi:nucleoside-diphosphate-sugar epimerase